MRVSVPHVPDPGGGRRGPAPATLRGSLIGLQRRAGNRAVGQLVRRASAGVLQRKVGWTDAVTAGHGWNVGERSVGSIRRIPLEDLPVGLPKDAAIPSLTTETAARRAIVYVPNALDAKQEVEYVVFLHGHTEDSSIRPFAGWRAFKPPTPGGRPRPPKKPADETAAERLRHGIDARDVAPVRDVALDEVGAQLEVSGLKQLVIVLPQGGLTSQFGDSGDKNFDAANYVEKISARLLAEQCWKDAKGKPVTMRPKTGRITMAGHSGAGATLANMANEAVRAILPAGAKDAPKPVPSSPVTGDLVIFDAINGSQLQAFQRWVLTRLNEDLKVVKDSSKAEPEKLRYLQSAPRLRGYFTNLYKAPYGQLENTIRGWFAAHKAELGPFARCLRANFMLTHVAVQHEELMRGVGLGSHRAHGIQAALLSLHQSPPKSVAHCPKMPEELEEEERLRKADERRRRAQERRDRSKRPATGVLPGR